MVLTNCRFVWSFLFQFKRRRRAAAPTPSRPRANNAVVVGSGTDAFITSASIIRLFTDKSAGPRGSICSKSPENEFWLWDAINRTCSGPWNLGSLNVARNRCVSSMSEANAVNRPPSRWRDRVPTKGAGGNGRGVVVVHQLLLLVLVAEDFQKQHPAQLQNAQLVAAGASVLAHDVTGRFYDAWYICHVSF